jgi:hypothetical protein
LFGAVRPAHRPEAASNAACHNNYMVILVHARMPSAIKS